MTGYLARLQEAIASSVDGMTQEELRRHPDAKWSVADVLEHLYLTYTGTTKGCERCLETGRPYADDATFKHRLQRFILITCGYMPSGREAPERTRPTGTKGEQVVQEIPGRLSEMESALQRCESRFGPNMRFLNHPILGPLAAWEWRKFHWVHGWHHVKQIRKLRETRA